MIKFFSLSGCLDADNLSPESLLMGTFDPIVLLLVSYIKKYNFEKNEKIHRFFLS